MTQRCVMHIADFASPHPGNFVASLRHLRSAIRDRLRMDTVFVFPAAAREQRWFRSFEADGIPVETVVRDSPRLDRIRIVASLAKTHGAAILHSHFGTFHHDVAFASRKVGARAVWHLHSQFSGRETVRERLAGYLKMAGLARFWVDRIVAVSEGVARDARAKGAPQSKISVIWNGIDFARIRTGADRASLRRRHGFSDDDVVFLLFGWEPHTKGVDIFAAAARELIRNGVRNLRPLIVSGESNRSRVSAMVADLPSAVVMEPLEEVAQLYSIADCFVSASRSEGFPASIGEAIVAGLPVISSDLPDLVRFYADAGNGFMTFRRGDSSHLARAMSKVLATRPEELRRPAEPSRTYVLRRLSVERWCDDLVSLYRLLLAP